MTEKRRLPAFAEETLSVLIETAGGPGENLGKDEANAALTADERFSEADAKEALGLLERRGYIYVVGKEIRITPTDE